MRSTALFNHVNYPHDSQKTHKKYKPFYPTQELVIEGVVIGAVREY